MTTSTGNGGWVMLPDELLIEVVGRLPLKSVCICKSICKNWRLTISNPEFMNSYGLRRKRSPTLLMLDWSCEPVSTRRYFLATLANRDPAAALEFEEWLNLPYKYSFYKFTQIINGLVCFYLGFRLSLLNLSTGETMLLPFPSRYGLRVSDSNRFFFGFDPISRAYKLLKVVEYCSCEILTLGDNMSVSSWEMVHGDAPFQVKPEQSVCVGGTLYWLEGDKRAIAFDLNTQTFSTMSAPPKVPGLNSSNFCNDALEFKGRLAFASIDFSLFWLVTLERNGSRWNREMFTLPTELWKMLIAFGRENQKLIPFGNLPTGEIMLVNPYSYVEAPVYSYDPENQKLERFAFGRFTGLKSEEVTACLSCFEVNFNPLNLILKPN